MITNELTNCVKELQKGKKEVFEMIYNAMDKQLFSVVCNFTKDKQLHRMKVECYFQIIK